ncbi:CRISPR-associated endonuclease Cas1 [Clostridia bacterium]|nr:CRISPR-associated endonuclease Cas1 [Clostridia bacterium]
MKKLLNTLYVTSPDSYLMLDGENVVIKQNEEIAGRIPLHNLEGIVTFGYTGASPALMGACAERNISLSFMKSSGKFLAGIVGVERGNVTLRKTQYRVSDDAVESAIIARNILIGKLHNSRWVLERACRDYALRMDVPRLKDASAEIAGYLTLLRSAANETDVLRGIEGKAGAVYFSVFDDLILQNKEDFFFKTRNRRPPLDNVNALLSFMYTIFTNDIAHALAANGLDPFVGFLHRDRPGRRSLALDMIEELRAPVVDRFVLTQINTKQLSASDFHQKENGEVLIKDDARKALLSSWQKRKQEEITHPFLKEKVEWGIVPHIQALLLSRHLRGDLEEYPPFLWK